MFPHWFSSVVKFQKFIKIKPKIDKRIWQKNIKRNHLPFDAVLCVLYILIRCTLLKGHLRPSFRTVMNACLGRKKTFVCVLQNLKKFFFQACLIFLELVCNESSQRNVQNFMCTVLSTDRNVCSGFCVPFQWWITSFCNFSLCIILVIHFAQFTDTDETGGCEMFSFVHALDNNQTKGRRSFCKGKWNHCFMSEKSARELSYSIRVDVLEMKGT